jgi:hypothetical protein
MVPTALSVPARAVAKAMIGAALFGVFVTSRARFCWPDSAAPLRASAPEPRGSPDATLNVVLRNPWWR